MDQPYRKDEFMKWLKGGNGDQPQVIHADTLLKLVGIIGLAMPWLLMGGSWLLREASVLQDSISDYYHSRARDLFVGVLCAIAFFLAAYRGYDRRDRIASLLACAFALGVAFFPTTPAMPDARQAFIGRIHLGCAAAFFIVLTVFALYLFRLSDPRHAMTPAKVLRNRVYLVCGILMATSLALIILFMLAAEGKYPGLDALRPVLVLESVALTAFGFSWLVKGGFILRDRQ